MTIVFQVEGKIYDLDEDCTPITSQVLAENNITTFAALRKKDPAYIEMVCSY